MGFSSSGIATTSIVSTRAMDVFVLASHREGFPRAAMEASAMALPVVATDVRGCREVVDHGVTGALVPVRDPSALAEALLSFDDPVRRARLGAAARGPRAALLRRARPSSTSCSTRTARSPAGRGSTSGRCDSSELLLATKVTLDKGLAECEDHSP